VLFESYTRRNYENYAQQENENGRTTLRLETLISIWARAAFLITYANESAYLDIGKLRRNHAAKAVEDGTHCGMLVQDEVEGGGFRFAHHRFQEYFTALYISKFANFRAADHEKVVWLSVLDEPRWQETILNLASLSGPMEAILALRNSIARERFNNQAPTNILQRALAEQRAADRVELASRIIREVGRTQVVPAKHYMKPLFQV
jgi:hypothetical protein